MPLVRAVRRASAAAPRRPPRATCCGGARRASGSPPGAAEAAASRAAADPGAGGACATAGAARHGRASCRAAWGVAAGWVGAYAAASRTWPLSVAFATCWVKGSASDLLTQAVVEQKARVDWRRNFAFATFSGAYAGCGQHYIYNVLFTRWFGSTLDTAAAVKKVAMDGLWHVPMLCLPLYYAFQDTVLRDGPVAGLRRYSEEWLDCMKPYWSMWTFFHLANFRYTPPELRIGLVACMSFFWLTVLSYISHRAYEASRTQEEAH